MTEVGSDGIGDRLQMSAAGLPSYHVFPGFDVMFASTKSLPLLLPLPRLHIYRDTDSAVGQYGWKQADGQDRRIFSWDLDAMGSAFRGSIVLIRYLALAVELVQAA